jgi:hypothetical protein
MPPRSRATGITRELARTGVNTVESIGRCCRRPRARIVGHRRRIPVDFDKSLSRCNVGGPGSSRWVSHRPREIVERTLKLDAALLSRPLARSPGRGHIVWRASFLNFDPTAAFVVERAGPYDWITIVFMWAGVRRHLMVDITTVDTGPIPRRFFVCPGLSRPCGRRSRVLYLAPLQDPRFACRHCHRLSYLSRQVPSRGINPLVARLSNRGAAWTVTR